MANGREKFSFEAMEKKFLLSSYRAFVEQDEWRNFCIRKFSFISFFMKIFETMLGCVDMMAFLEL